MNRSTRHGDFVEAYRWGQLGQSVYSALPIPGTAEWVVEARKLPDIEPPLMSSGVHRIEYWTTAWHTLLWTGDESERRGAHLWTPPESEDLVAAGHAARDAALRGDLAAAKEAGQGLASIAYELEHAQGQEVRIVNRSGGPNLRLLPSCKIGLRFFRGYT